MRDVFVLRIPRRWVRAIVLVAVTAAVVAPATVWAQSVFSDVPDGSTHAEGIEYVADKGITVGCEDDLYCPNDPVTRAQMATFLYRSSGNDPATAASVNADLVDGSSAEQLRSVAEASGGPGCTDVTDVVQTCAQVTIEVPADGKVLVSGHGSVITFGAQTNGFVGVSDSNGTLGAAPSRVGPLDTVATTGDRWRFTAAPIGSFDVSAGTHTFYLNAQRTSPFDQNQVNVGNAYITALFVPNS
jgi:S-layer homology domain